MGKKYIKSNVYDESVKRTKYIFDNFEKVYISFSGGKDSSVCFHLAAQEAKSRNRTLGVLIVDLEAQYEHTITHIEEMVSLYKDCIDLYWVAEPLSLRNAVSVFEPKWVCWDKSKKEIWVREKPKHSYNHNGAWDEWFEHGMEFEDFVPRFGDWYSQGGACACIVGIRTDESLNRYRAITSKKKRKYKDMAWTTKIWETTVYNCYPIYDWKTKDIWTYNNKTGSCYNKLYDLMHQAGLSIHQQRICQPYGDDQRKGLWLYHVIEPETWAKVVARVAGVNSGAEFVQWRGNASGTISVSKPDGHTWESYANMILETLPDELSEHYRNKIHVFLKWYETKGYPRGIPDEASAEDESKRKAPSWRRIVKMLLRNDYWAKGLSFTQTKSGYFYTEYLKRIKKDREKRKREFVESKSISRSLKRIKNECEIIE